MIFTNRHDTHTIFQLGASNFLIRSHGLGSHKIVSFVAEDIAFRLIYLDSLTYPNAEMTYKCVFQLSVSIKNVLH